jgi:hypothetical protein
MLTRPPPAPRTRTTGRAPRRAPGAALRQPQPLPCLVLEADEGAQVARHTFISGHTSAFHTATASSSRSIACRTGTWQDQPCRRISFHTPSTVYPMRNSLPISVLIRPSVHRWVPSEPVRQRTPAHFGLQPGPLLRAQPLLRHRALRPQRRGPAVPPGPAPPPDRPLGDPQVVRDLADRVAAGEPSGRRQPQTLTPLLLGGRVPAPLRIPRGPAIRRRPPNVTT